MAGRVPPQGARSDLAITTPFGKSDAVGDALELKAFDLETGGGGPSYRAMLRLSGEATLTKPFLQNPFVYACVMAIARAASTVPLRLYRRDSNDNAQDAVVRNHKLFSLLERPNPLLSQKKLWRTQAVYHCLYGETFWIMLKRVSARGRMLVRPVNLGEIPDEIWPVRGDLVEPVIDENTKLPVAWRLSVGSQAVDYPDHAVAQFAEVDPYNPMRGVGPMQAAFRTATKDFTCDRYDDALLKNGGSPGGVLSSTQPLTEQQLSVIRNSWNEGQGRTEEHRKTAVIPFGMEYKQFGFSPADMEFKDLRSWNRETIMSVFGVTRPILGLTEGLNYASAREAFRVFWEVTVCPYLEFQADEFNSKVLAKFEPQESGLYAAFDTSNVASLRETIDSKIDRTMKLFQQCGRSFDEAARLAGWQIPPTTMGDRMFVPASMAPLPEEKAMYDAQLLAARAAGAQQVPDAPAPAAKDVSPADIIRAIEVVDGEPTTATEANTRRLAEHAALIDEHAPKIAKRAKRVMRDYLLASRAKLRSVAGSQLEANSDVQKIILTEQEVEDLLQMNEDNWRKEMRDALEKPMHAAWDAAAKAAFIKIASDGLFMSSSDPVALQFLNDHLVQLSEGTMSTLAIQVRRTIIKVLASAPDDAVRLQDAIRLTLRELEDQVEVMIDNLDARADLIAQTEANAMANAASAMQWRELGIETHTWLTAGDERVRHSHQELNGKTVRIGDVFGYNLRWPGDPQASVEQVAECRCTTLAEPNQ